MAFLTVCLNPALQKTLRFPLIIPGSVNRTSACRLDASGKGINVTRVLTQLGKKAVHLTQLGGVMRPLFLSLCGQDNLSVEWVESESQIRFCYTLLSEDNEDGVTELVEESEPVGAETEKLLIEKYCSLLTASGSHGAPNFSCVIISGTKAAGFSDEVIPRMVRKAKENGLKVILDIKGKDLIESLKYAPDIIKPNLLEFASTFTPHLITNNKIEDNTSAREQIKSAVLDINAKYGCRVILTNGGGKILAADGDNFFQADIQSVKAVNTTGCGDAFTAGLAAALENPLTNKATFSGAIAEGIRCGALNAGLVRPGVIC